MTLFPVLYGGVAALGERRGYGRWRERALREASGRLLVVGLGPGHDLAHLPPAVTEVLAVEPDPAMRRAARRRAAAARVPVRQLGGVAEALPLASGSVDAVLVALVLCSVTDPGAAAVELRRVLRPGGMLHVLEHVAAPHGTPTWRRQQRFDGLWTRIAAGCHVTRDTRAVLADAGFDTSALVDRVARPAPPLVGPHLVGTARAR